MDSPAALSALQRMGGGTFRVSNSDTSGSLVSGVCVDQEIVIKFITRPSPDSGNAT